MLGPQIGTDSVSHCVTTKHGYAVLWGRCPEMVALSLMDKGGI